MNKKEIENKIEILEDNKKIIKQNISALKLQLHKIDDLKRLEKNRFLIGKCFKCDSSNQYYKTYGINRDGALIAFSFGPNSCYGDNPEKRFIITKKSIVYLEHRYTEISKKEFENKWNELLPLDPFEENI